MTVLAFLAFSLRRLRSRFGLTLLLLLSVVLTVGIVVCIPVFANAVARHMMEEELNQRTNSLNRAAFSVRYYAWPRPAHPLTRGETEFIRDWLADTLRREVGLPLQSVYVQIESPMGTLLNRGDQTRFAQKELGTVRIASIERVQDHIALVAGEPFGRVTHDDVLNVWVAQSYAASLSLQVGDTFSMSPTYNAGDQPIALRVVGIFSALDPLDHFWSWQPNQLFQGLLLTTPEQYEAYVYPVASQKIGFASWYYVLDDSRMNLDSAPRYVSALERIARDVETRLPGGQMNDGPMAELLTGQRRKTALTVILVSFSLPLLGTLICFVIAISAMLVRFQSQEVSILVSRGSSRAQILALMAQETLLILVVGIPLGLLVGLALAWLLGHSYSFLQFLLPRGALPLPSLDLTAIDWRLVGLSAILFGAARLFPAWVATRSNILAHERASARGEHSLGAARILSMVLLVGVAIYAYHQLALRGTLALVSWLPGDPTNDPLLLLTPSLFFFAAPWVAGELFLLGMRPLATVGRLLRHTGGYLGCLNLAREGGQYRLLIFMLILSLALGVFYASLAVSADTWLVDRRRHEFGADVTFALFPDEAPSPAQGQGSAAPSALQQAQASAETPVLVPVSQFESIAGVAHATRVGDFLATTLLAGPAAEGQPQELRLLAIDRTVFPQVAYFRPDYASRPLGDLMNRLGQDDRAILLPADLATRLQVAEGDRLRLSVAFDYPSRKNSALRQAYEFVVVGTFNHFPTSERGDAGGDMAVAVANLDYLQTESGGALPYGIWMRLVPSTRGEQIRESLTDLRIIPYNFRDLGLALQNDRLRLERVGIFGMTSICFLACALLAVLGLAVFNGASMVRRSTRLAVVQALGLSRGEMILSVAVEHIGILACSLLAGLAVGVGAARLYVPFMPLADTRQVLVPPFVAIIDWPRALWLAAGVTLALVLTEVVVLFRVARARVFEVLRLGTRE